MNVGCEVKYSKSFELVMLQKICAGFVNEFRLGLPFVDRNKKASMAFRLLEDSLKLACANLFDNDIIILSTTFFPELKETWMIMLQLYEK